MTPTTHRVKLTSCINAYGENMKRSKRIAAALTSLTTIVATAFATISAAQAHAADSDTSVPPEITMPGSPDGIPSVSYTHLTLPTSDLV